MRPIPKRMLPHNCTYEKYLGDTGEGISFSSPVALNNVKIEERSQFNYTSNGRELIGNAILFYDCINSNGLTEAPIPESKIIFNNKTYTVVDVDVLYANSNQPHHYEVLLK